MKSIVIAGLLLGAAHGAHAAPASFINVEANQSYQDGLTGTVTDIHYGLEGGEGPYSWFGQFGPSLVNPQVGDGELRFSGKLGGAVDVGPASIYGEVSGTTTSGDPAIGVKAGVKYAL